MQKIARIEGPINIGSLTSLAFSEFSVLDLARKVMPNAFTKQAAASELVRANNAKQMNINISSIGVFNAPACRNPMNIINSLTSHRKVQEMISAARIHFVLILKVVFGICIYKTQGGRSPFASSSGATPELWPARLQRLWTLAIAFTNFPETLKGLRLGPKYIHDQRNAIPQMALGGGALQYEGAVLFKGGDLGRIHLTALKPSLRGEVRFGRQADREKRRRVS